MAKKKSFSKILEEQFDECNCGQPKYKGDKECRFCERLKQNPRHGKELIYD